MDRRKIILAFIALAAVSVMPNIQAVRSTKDVVTSISRNRRKKSHDLKPGDIYTAEPDTAVNLPFNPTNGDQVHITIGTESLKKPCLVEFYDTKIAGNKEPLILDTLAIIKLTYNSASNNWRLG